MSSSKVENRHKHVLEQLLQNTGLECVRSPPEVEEECIAEEDEEQGAQIEEAPKKAAEEAIPEEEQAPEEEVEEEQPEVFPTPSLRRVVPDKLRKIEEFNRIHVLPEEFKTNIDPAAIPRISTTPMQKTIDTLAEMLGCKKFKSSLAEYWFLDTMANLLRRAQEDELDRPTQAVLMLWFCEWMKEMQHFDAADRKRMLKRFQDNMLNAARFVAAEDHLPTPMDIDVSWKAKEEAPSQTSPKPSGQLKHLVTFEGAAYECSLRDLTKIIHYIFDLFSTDYQYDLVRSIFTHTPEYELIDAPYQIQMPKRIWAPLKIKPKKEKSPKKEVKPAKGKKKDVDTEDYLALMELKAKEERDLEEQANLDLEEWNKRSHILPLAMAADEEFFDKYWPPPPPEPEPEVVPEPKGKGKKGKK